MIAHKCDGCRYKGEHQEMGFRPFGVCTKETDLVNATKNYNAETCPYDKKIFITNAGFDIKTPYDKKIAEAAREVSGEEKPAYLPQLYKIEGVDLAEEEPWPKENPFLIKPLPEIEETDNIADFNAQIEKLKAAALEAAEKLGRALTAAAEALRPLVERVSEALSPILASIDHYSKLYECYPNKRVVYLATHGKRRTRKKNINRIIKDLRGKAKNRA